MTPSRAAAVPGAEPPAAQAFSLVLGGPLYRLLVRTRLARPQLELLHRRMLVIPALAWVPLLVLTAAEGHAIGGVGTPFLHDIDACARFLVAMPVLILAEVVVHRQLRMTVPAFRDRGIVPPAALARFDDAVARAARLRDSPVPEVVLLVLVLLLGPWAWRHGLAPPADTWYATDRGDGRALTAAGLWFIHLSAPMFQFLLLRWYFRIAIWWLFLWRVSRLPLVLKAAHPDRSAGLGFLGDSALAFVPLLFAQAALVSGFVASRVTTGAISLLDFRSEIAVLIVLLVAMVMLPLLFFVPDLMAARREALRHYDALGSRYVREFEGKWFSDTAPAGGQLLDSGDLQTLADLAGGGGVARGMWPVPMDARTFVQVVLVACAPFVPLALTVVPLAELLQRLAAMVL